VANIKEKSQQSYGRSADREAYVPPKLKEFGPVGNLTQAGSGTTAEAMANGMASMSMNQRA
jgi:hypothetical protein